MTAFSMTASARQFAGSIHGRAVFLLPSDQQLHACSQVATVRGYVARQLGRETLESTKDREQVRRASSSRHNLFSDGYTRTDLGMHLSPPFLVRKWSPSFSALPADCTFDGRDVCYASRSVEAPYSGTIYEYRIFIHHTCNNRWAFSSAFYGTRLFFNIRSMVFIFSQGVCRMIHTQI
jgi:hypothetical protein